MTTRADLINLILYATPAHVATDQLEEIAADYLLMARELSAEKLRRDQLEAGLEVASKRTVDLAEAFAAQGNPQKEEL